jgi:biopolymer transport protein TolR
MATSWKRAPTTLKSTKRRQPEPEMNVTPLVDVTLVLLIIMMVVAPSISEGEQIELPVIEQPDQKPKDEDPIEVTVAANGVLVVEDERVEDAQLRPRLEQLHREDASRSVRLKCDQSLAYGEMRNKFTLLQDIGFHGVQLKVMAKKEPGESGG